MARTPRDIARFLESERIAVAGVSRDSRQPANAIYRRLLETGHTVYPINPKADEVEGVPCYPDLAAVPGPLGGVVVATPPSASRDIVEQCASLGIGQVWFHRSIGDGSVSEEAVRACEQHGITAIVGGCPLMFCGKVDVFHACMRWVMQRTGKVPG